MLTLDQVRALVSVADTTRAYRETQRDYPQEWLLAIRERVYYESLVSAEKRGVSPAQIHAITTAVTDEVLHSSSSPTTAA